MKYRAAILTHKNLDGNAWMSGYVILVNDVMIHWSREQDLYDTRAQAYETGRESAQEWIDSAIEAQLEVVEP